MFLSLIEACAYISLLLHVGPYLSPSFPHYLIKINAMVSLKLTGMLTKIFGLLAVV